MRRPRGTAGIERCFGREVSNEESRRTSPAGRTLPTAEEAVSDPVAVRAICDIAGEYEVTAAELEKRHLIRERAHAIWISAGRPQGRDVENWLAAERELAAEEQREGRVRRRA
jgi:hypothetical protein